ncbi:MAG: 3-deoxy-D-manno-octulosonic acid transferase, partial [Deltaproteobacteria bacterium]|nr:3-deoxy-D-manno-octulosonic acid transferase [Deltaproteobacteria bacterium]
MRADNAVAPADCPQLREEFRLPQESLVWACGSTHEGEEEILLRVYGRLRMQWPSLVLALAPRHPRRFRTVAELVRREGFVLRLRSEITPEQALFTEGGVLLMDVMGEMLRLYALADLVFVGGSLVSVGGHNVLEASLMHRAVLFGPHMHNFREIVRLLLEAGGGAQVQDEAELEEKAAALLSDASLRGQMGEHGFRLLMENQGATEKTMAILKRLLPEP